MDGKEGLMNVARVRDLLAEDPRAGDELRRGRAAFLEEVERRNAGPGFRRPSRRARGRWPALLVSTAVAAGMVGAWLWARPASFQVGEAREGQLGNVIEAAAGGVTPISFSEGSTLAVHDGGRIRVLSIESRGARVLVEDGVVDAHIAPRKPGNTRWVFELGPYRVVVNGTKFRMAFRAAASALSVSTQEGRVTVEGGCLKAPAAVSAGETLAPSCPPREAPPANDVPEAEAPLAPAPTLEATPAARTMRAERWRELLAGGRLLDGLRAAERADFDQVCRAASAKELLALSDAGRFFGPSKRAVAALTALRRRFPGSLEAGTAAFTLGRIVFEKDREYAEAAKWFETYLREQPTGPLMGDAFGRLMEARLHAGDGTGARASAAHYLRRFPEGPYASEARGILSR
jgi:TolA-binding protein